MCLQQLTTAGALTKLKVPRNFFGSGNFLTAKNVGFQWKRKAVKGAQATSVTPQWGGAGGWSSMLVHSPRRVQCIEPLYNR